MPPEIPDLTDDYELGETQADHTSTIIAGIHPPGRAGGDRFSHLEHPPMTTRPPRKPKAVAEPPNSVEAAVAIAARLTEEAAAMQAPVMSRAATARNMAQQRRNELARERSDFVDRINLLSAQYKAAVDALQAHIDDIDEEDALYANGFPAKSNVEPIRQDVERDAA